MKRVSILGIPIDPLSVEEALEQIESFVDSDQPHQITTVNPEFIIEAQQDKEFRSILQAADLSLADGSGIVWAGRYLGDRIPERIAGSDLVVEIAKLAQDRDWKIYLLGGGPGVAELAARALEKRFPSLLIVGCEEGLPYRADLSKDQFDEKEAMAAIKRINQVNPDILYVAFGAPKQELFIARYKEQLKVPVMIGVGGTFDFLAGRIKRAPKLFRSLWLEWLWRLIMEPKRWRRIFKAVIVFPYLVITKKND